MSKFLLVAILLVSARVADTDRAETRDQDRAERATGICQNLKSQSPVRLCDTEHVSPGPGGVALGWIETKNARVLRETGP